MGFMRSAYRPVSLIDAWTISMDQCIFHWIQVFRSKNTHIYHIACSNIWTKRVLFVSKWKKKPWDVDCFSNMAAKKTGYFPQAGVSLLLTTRTCMAFWRRSSIVCFFRQKVSSRSPPGGQFATGQAWDWISTQLYLSTAKMQILEIGLWERYTMRCGSYRTCCNVDVIIFILRGRMPTILTIHVASATLQRDTEDSLWAISLHFLFFYLIKC